MHPKPFNTGEYFFAISFSCDVSKSRYIIISPWNLRNNEKWTLQESGELEAKKYEEYLYFYERYPEVFIVDKNLCT